MADGAATQGRAELSLGKKPARGFSCLGDGFFNYEDAILVSERLVSEDVFTSIHNRGIRGPRSARPSSARKEFTRDIPNVGEKALSNLDGKRHRCAFGTRVEGRRHPGWQGSRPRRQERV